MEELKLNEKELIELTIQYGYDGSELNNPHFIEKGYLKNNNKYQKFIEKVESICESWEKLRKKKGENHPYYIIRGLKPVDNVNLVIEDKRSIAQHDENIEIMAKYLYNQLLKSYGSESYTLNRWMTMLGGFNHEMIDNNEKIHDYFDKLYYGADLNDIKRSVKEYIKHKNQRIMGQLINHLKHNHLIFEEKNYGAFSLNNQFEKIEKDTYDRWKNQLKEIVENYGLKTNNYRYYLKFDEYKGLKEDLELHFKKTGYNNVFTLYGFYINNLEEFDVDYEQFKKAYKDKLIKDINNLQECDKKYQNYFNQRYKKYNYLKSLDLFDWAIDKELLEQYKPDLFSIEIMIKNRLHQEDMQIPYKRMKEEMNQIKSALSSKVDVKLEISLDDFFTTKTMIKLDDIPNPSEILNPLNFLPFIVDNAVKVA